MGSSISTPSTKCAPPPTPTTNASTTTEAPPALVRPQSFEEKLYDKFRRQPLVPIGCAATAYFLASGIRSFQKRDPMRAQKMMRARVGAQFATLATFVYYVGFNNVNFDIAPAYYRAKEQKEALEKAKQQQNSSAD